jgi:Na+/proline symporter
MTPTLIFTSIAVYFSMLLVIAWFTGRKATSKSYFIGNKTSPWYLVAFGMIGASLSGVTFISIPGVVGNFDSVNGKFSYMQLALGYLVGYAVIATVLMPLYYRLNLTSIYTYLEQRFGFWSYKTGASFFILSKIIGACFRIFLVTIVLQRFVFDAWNVPFPVTVILTLFLIWIYTFKGGIKTIVWTDSLQTLFMLIAVGMTIYLIGDALQMSFAGMIKAVKESEFSQTFFWDPKADNFFFKQFFSGAFIAIVMTGLDQDMMQKNNSCKNIGEAQKNMFTFSIILVVVNLLFVSLGALLYMYAETKGIQLPGKTDYVFPTLAIEHFVPLAGLVFVLGLIAAAYSSADSALTSLTTSFCIDFLGFEKKADLEQGNSVKTRYLVHLGFTVIFVLVIMLFRYVLQEDVISSVFKAAGYTYGPLLGLFSFGLFTKYPVRDKLVPAVCIAAPIISFIINENSVAWFAGYKFGFEILIVNGLLTFVGLLFISKRE